MQIKEMEINQYEQGCNGMNAREKMDYTIC